MSDESPKIPPLVWKSAIVVAVIAAISVYFYFLSSASANLPQQLGDGQLVQLIDGERANEILNRMHDKEVTPATNLIGVYTSGNTVVYLSVYRSRRDAQKAYTRMARSIEKGNPLFTDYRVTQLGGVEASFCYGQEQDHYFFVYKDRLYWLAADHPAAETMSLALVESL